MLHDSSFLEKEKPGVVPGFVFGEDFLLKLEFPNTSAHELSGAMIQKWAQVTDKRPG